jgi:hypothetical protein
MSYTNNIYQTIILNNKSIIFSGFLLIFCISFIFEYYHDYCNRVSEIQHYLNLGPPEHCQAGTKPYEEIGFSEWIIHKLYRNERDADCLRYIETILQPYYPNPLDSLLSVTSRIMGLPILALFSALSTAINTANRLFAQTLFTTLIICAATMYAWQKLAVVALGQTSTRPQQQDPTPVVPIPIPQLQLPSTAQVNMVDFVKQQLSELFGDTLQFIKAPYFNPEELRVRENQDSNDDSNTIEMKIFKNKTVVPDLLTQEQMHELCTQEALNAAD